MAKGNYLNAASTGTAPAQSVDTEPERSADDIRQDIAARRESISETVDRLSDRFQQTFDWRTYVSNYPVAALGVAVGLGFLVSGIFKPRPTPVERMKEALADGLEDFTGHLHSQLDHLTVRQPSLNQTVKAAATGFLVKAAAEYIRNRASNAYQQPQTERTEREEITGQSNIAQASAPDKWGSRLPTRD